MGNRCFFCESLLQENISAKYINVGELFYNGKFVCASCCKKDLYVDGAYVPDLLRVRNAILLRKTIRFYNVPYDTNCRARFFDLFPIDVDGCSLESLGVVATRIG